MDDLCDTSGSLVVGISAQLHDGRIHPHFARYCNHCSSGWSLSEAMTFSQRRLGYILTLQSDDRISRAGKGSFRMRTK